MKFVKKFRTTFSFQWFFRFFIKKSIFLKNYSIFFPSCFEAPYKSFEDIFWEKIKKKNVKKFRMTFFFHDFYDFLSQKRNFSKTIRHFFLFISRPLKRNLKTFSEKNSEKVKKNKFVKKFRITFFIQRFFQFFIQKSKFLKKHSILFPSFFEAP